MSGATLRQLAHWRAGPSALLRPAGHQPRARLLYSFPDVVALRTIVYLRRSRNVSLQRIRRAVEQLRVLGEVEHLSTYTLIAVGRDVVWRQSSTDAVALTGQPGQFLLAHMVDILSEFTTKTGVEVRSLQAPEPGVSVNRDILAGYPVIEGTRVPYDLVADLLSDGMTAADVAAIYPSVATDAALGALAFAERVEATRRVVHAS